MAVLLTVLEQHLDRQPPTVVTQATTWWETVLALAGCDNFSCDYALPSRHEIIVGGGWGPNVGRRRVRGGDMLTTLVVG